MPRRLGILIVNRRFTMDENVMKLCEDLDAFALIYNQMADCDSKIYQNNEVGIESYIAGKVGLKPKKLDVPI